VSTSIRPSTLPYPELYTWQGCANFVSDHLQYQAPKRPLAMVSKIIFRQLKLVFSPPDSVKVSHFQWNKKFGFRNRNPRLIDSMDFKYKTFNLSFDTRILRSVWSSTIRIKLHPSDMNFESRLSTRKIA